MCLFNMLYIELIYNEFFILFLVSPQIIAMLCIVVQNSEAVPLDSYIQWPDPYVWLEVSQGEIRGIHSMQVSCPRGENSFGT
jgi:hypothetical protein